MILIGGLFLLLVGGVILAGVVAVGDSTLWLPVILIFSGLFLLPVTSQPKQMPSGEIKMHRNSTATLVALTLLFLGAFMLLRAFGVISLPWFRYIVGGGLLIVGIYGVVSGSVQILRSNKSTSNTQRPGV